MVILDLEYVEIYTTISLIERTQTEIWKVKRTKCVTLNLEVNRQESNKYSLIFVIFVLEIYETIPRSIRWHENDQRSDVLPCQISANFSNDVI